MELVNVISKVWIQDIGTIVWLFQQWWAYFVIPIIVYFVFFILKWLIITAPIWIPLSLITKMVTFKK